VLVKVLIKRRRRRIKTNSTREIINYPRARGKKGMKGVEAVSNISNTVKALIDIFDRTLKIGLLFHSKFGSSGSVRGLILGVV